MFEDDGFTEYFPLASSSFKALVGSISEAREIFVIAIGRERLSEGVENILNEQ
jgi:hypothetical protein